MANESYLEGLLAPNASTIERLIMALRLQIGDDDATDGPDFHDEELYLFLRDGNKLVNTMGYTTNLTFNDSAMSVGGTVTNSIATTIMWAADYLLWRRLEREGTRRAVSIREMDTAIDTREIARSAALGMRERWIQLNSIVKEMRRGDLTPSRINTYVQRYFPAADQTLVDETRSSDAERI